MHTAAPADHYQPIKGGRNAPLVGTYAHTTPLVPPVPIATTTKQPVVTDIVTNIQPSAATAATQPIVAAPLATQTTTTTTTTATQPIVSAPAAVQQTTTATTRPTQVIETLYPTAQSRTADVAAVGASAVVAGAAATQTARTQTTTTTQAAVVPAATRKGLDLDVTATGVDSYAAPTPIHLTIHPDPTEETAAVVGGAAAATADANAIAYLHSVHPALPVANSSTAALQQPQPTHARRTSEGAATSINGLWTPMTAATQGVPTQPSPAPVHGDQLYASEAPVIPSHPIEGSVMETNLHDHQYYASSTRVERDAGVAAGAALGAAAMRRSELPTSSVEQVRPISNVNELSGAGKTAVPVAMSTAGPLVVGQTSQVGGVQRITQVDQASGLSGERMAVATTQRAMPAAQTFSSTTAPQVVMVPGIATAASSQQSSVQPPLSPAPVHGDQLYASEAPVIPSHPIQGSVMKTNPHDHQYYASSTRVERDAGVAAGAALGAAAMHRSELPVTAQGERILPVDDVSTLSGDGRMAVPLASAAAAGPLVLGETRQLGGVQRIAQIDQASSLSGERVAVATTQRAMPAAQTFTSTTGPQVVEVSDATNLLGGFHTPVLVNATTAAPLVVGETNEVGVSETLEEVDDVSRLSRAVPVAVTSTQRPMPAGQTFTSTAAPAVVHVPGTYTANVVQPTETRFTQRLEGESSAPSVVQVADGTAVTGERLALANRVSTGPMVTSSLPNTSQLESITHVSHTSHLRGEQRTPVMVESVACGPLVVGETAQLGSTAANVMQVNEVRGERLALANTAATTTGTLRTMELVGESQPQVRYSFNQTNQAATLPASTAHNVQNVQNVQRRVEDVHTVQQRPVMEERTTITREAVSAEEAAAHSTTQQLDTHSADTTYQSLTTQQAAGLEERHERIDGKVHIMYVDKSRMEGREAVPVGPYGAFTKESDAVDTMSSGVKDMQLNESERQSYSKEQI